MTEDTNKERDTRQCSFARECFLRQPQTQRIKPVQQSRQDKFHVSLHLNIQSIFTGYSFGDRFCVKQSVEEQMER